MTWQLRYHWRGMGLSGEVLTCDFCGKRCAEYTYPDFERPLGWHETGNTEENWRIWCPGCWEKASLRGGAAAVVGLIP